MGLELFIGTVTHIERGGGMSLSKGLETVTDFELDGQSMQISSKSVLPIKAGHKLIVAGQRKANGQVKVTYLENTSNGTQYADYISGEYGIAVNIGYIIVGLLLFFLIFPLLIAVWAIMNIRKVGKAKRMVRNAALPSSTHS